MLDSIQDALEALKRNEMIIVVDDEDRENEGDLIAVGETITPEMVNFMATHGRGLICTPMSREYAERLQLNPMVSKNTDHFQTAFTVSVDHVDSTTGISAFERAHTIKELANIKATASDFDRPGHVFPLIAKDGGVVVRNGHTEAGVDLAQMIGCAPVGVICEIMKDDGEMARFDDLVEYKKKHNLKMISIEDLIKYRIENEMVLDLDSKVNLPSQFGQFKMHTFIHKYKDENAIALTSGEIKDGCHVRIHSECLTGDAFNSKRCDCGEQLERSMRLIDQEGGILIYLHQEGRGIGLVNKMRAYALQEQGEDTLDANIKLGFEGDVRTYELAYQILKHFGLNEVTLLTNNPLKINELKNFGIIVSSHEMEIDANEINKKYLKTKKDRMDHTLKGDYNE